ncbi:methylosome subunit pICln isoform X4 [Hemitrygon akajei]|uniref:methylosome subunit pICln isoform X4 n=1 Tax=Hemitrygon akajei TaxID=2704970 RepID=UPI003BF99CFD
MMPGLFPGQAAPHGAVRGERGSASPRAGPPGRVGCTMVFLKCFPPPAEGVRLQQPEIAAVLDGKGLGTGTLYIAESRLSWFDGSGLGFSLEYPSISLHAVSRDVTVYPQEHLYVMVNAKLGEQGQGDIPTFCTYDEAFSHLNPEGQATLQRLEGMLAQSVAQQVFHMAGVRTDDSAVDNEDGMEVDATPVETGQFDDADVDH